MWLRLRRRVAKLEAEVASLQAEVARVAERRAQTAESAGLPEDEWESEEKKGGRDVVLGSAWRPILKQMAKR
jgi:hypothetical protein